MKTLMEELAEIDSQITFPESEKQSVDTYTHFYFNGKMIELTKPVTIINYPDAVPFKRAIVITEDEDENA